MNLLKGKLHLVLAFVAIVVLISACDNDDDGDCTSVTWYQDADGDGLGNPAVSQVACDQPTGYVSNADDTEDCETSTWYEDSDGDGLGNPDVSQEACDQPDGYVEDNTDNNDALSFNCTFEDDPRCYCTNNPDDAMNCMQSFGDTVFYGGFELFAAGTLVMGDLEHQDQEFETYGSLNGGEADDVTALQGEKYLSFIVDPYNTTLRDGSSDAEGIFSVRQNKEPRIDLTAYSDPHINIWVNTGSSATNIASIDFEMKYSSGDRERFHSYDFNGEENGQEPSTIAVTTEGEWQLFSIPISQAIWHLDVDEGEEPVITNIWTLEGKEAADKTFERLAVHFRVNDENPNLAPDDPAGARFVAHVDALSISEGPLVDVRPID